MGNPFVNVNTDISAGTSVVAGAVGISTALAATTTTAEIAGLATGIGAIASVAILAIEAFLHSGCGAPCIDSAKIEQVFEVAADEIQLAAANNWISAQAATMAINQLLQKGIAQYAKFPQLASHGQAGVRNMTNVLNAEIQAIPQGATGSTPFPANWQSLLMQWRAGWYQDAFASGLQLATTLLSAMKQAQTTASAQSSPAISGVINAATKATGLSGSDIIVGGAAALMGLGGKL